MESFIAVLQQVYTPMAKPGMLVPESRTVELKRPTWGGNPVQN
jgi:hypothetical protein